MSELTQSKLEAALSAALPDHLRTRAGELAAAIVRAVQDGSRPAADPEVLRALGNAEIKVDGRLIDFGAGNQFGDIRIRDVVGGDKYEISLTVPSEPWRIAEEDVADCPYPGLAVFGDGDANYFFGRDGDIQRLLQHINRPIVAVTGPSGVGKSSFVLAGVLPRLRDQQPTLKSVIFRVSTSAELLRDLAVTLESYTGQPLDVLLETLKAGSGALREILLGMSAAGRVVLVLDQFEELFVGTDKVRKDDRTRLLDMLIDIEQIADPRLLVILTSRENYFEHQDYRKRPDLRPIIQQRNVGLDGLNDAQLREAIIKPLDAFNARPERIGKTPIIFENGVIDLFEQEFRRTERTLPLVQYLLRLLWTEQRELSKSAYTTLGGLERALDRHASKIYESFGADDQQLVQAVLLALVRPGIDNEYTRRRVPRDELIGAGAQHDRVNAVVGRLASQDSRIISDQQVGQTNYIELTHEILLRQWERLRLLIDTYRKRLESREQLLPFADQWHQSLARTNSKGDPAHLYRGSTLRQARDYIHKNDLPEGVDTGIQACYQASVRHQRRQIVRATVATIAIVALLGFGFNWFTADQRARLAAEQELSSQRATAQVIAEQTAQAEAVQRATAQAERDLEAERAAREAEVANSQRLANQARQLLEQGNRPLAVTLALEANNIADPPLQAQLALAEVAYAPGYARSLDALPESNTDPCVFDTELGRRTIRAEENNGPYNFVLYDASTNTPMRSTRIPDAFGIPPEIDANEFVTLPQWCPQISPDGRYALIGLILPPVNFGVSEQIMDGTLALWDLSTGQLIEIFSNFAGQAYFSPSGSSIAYATLDDSINFWQFSAIFDVAPAVRARQPFFWSPYGDFLLATGTADEEVVVLAMGSFGASEFVRWSGAGKPIGFASDGGSVYVENEGIEEWSISNAALLQGQRSNAIAASGNIAGAHWIGVSESAQRALSFETGGDAGYVLLSGEGLFDEFEELEFPDMGLGGVYGFPVLSADGRTALVTNVAGLYRLDMISGEMTQLPYEGSTGFNLMAISDDGSVALVTDSTDRSKTQLIQVENGTVLHSLDEPDQYVVGVRIASDGRWAVTLHQVGTDRFADESELQVTVWDLETGNREHVLELGQGELANNSNELLLPMANVVFSPDGTYLATAFTGGSLKLWNTADGVELWSIPAAGGVIGFSPDGAVIANGNNGTIAVQLVDVQDGALLTTLTDSAAPIAFSPDGSLIATGGIDGLVRVFDVVSGSELRRFNDTARHITFEPNGRSLFVSGVQGVRRWRIDSLPDLIEWTKENRVAAPLSCEQRALYQVSPLCPPGTVATAAPTNTPGVAPTTMPTNTARPTVTDAPIASPDAASPTTEAPSPVVGTVYRVIPTSDGFVAVRESPTRQSAEVQRLTAGTEIVCTETVTGEEIAGVNTWVHCPSVGGYIYQPLLNIVTEP